MLCNRELKMSEWRALSLPEVSKGMRIKHIATGHEGLVVDKSEGAVFIVDDIDSREHVLFGYELADFLFMSAVEENKTEKVLSKEEIYEMLLSDPILHHVSLKAVRKIEKVVVTKLALEGGNNAVLP